MGTGQLIFSIKTAQNALPVQSVRVTVTREENGEIVFDRELVTDADGNTQPISLTAPDMALSLDESYRGAAYETYDVVIEADRYLPFTIKNLQIFDQRTALQEVQMIPDDTGSHAAPASTMPCKANVRNTERGRATATLSPGFTPRARSRFASATTCSRI